MRMVSRSGEGARDRPGAFLALAAAATGFLGVAAFAMAPSDQHSFAPTPEFLGSVASDDSWLRFSFVLSTLFALLAVGTVAAVGRLLGADSSSLVLAATAIGMLGYAVTALQNATDLVAVPAVAGRYADEGVLPAQLARIDPGGFLQTLAIGTWLGVAAILGRQRASFSPWLTILGMAAGAGFILAAVAAGSGVLGEPNLAVTLFVAGIVIPAWFIGVALVLLRSGATRASAAPG